MTRNKKSKQLTISLHETLIEGLKFYSEYSGIPYSRLIQQALLPVIKADMVRVIDTQLKYLPEDKEGDKITWREMEEGDCSDEEKQASDYYMAAGDLLDDLTDVR